MKALIFLACLLAGASHAAPPAELVRKYEDVKKENEATPYRLEINAYLDLILESSRRAAEKNDFPQAEEYLAKAQKLVALKRTFKEAPKSVGYELKWLRRGKVHFLGVVGDTVSITAVPVQNWEQYHYITGPGNRTVFKSKVKTDRVSSQDFIVEPKQEGLYTLHLKQSYVYRITFRKTKKVVFEPEREFTSLFQNQAHSAPLWFRVPEGAKELKVIGTNLHGSKGSAATLRFNPQANSQETVVDLPELNEKSLARKLNINVSDYKSDWSSDESDVANYRIVTESKTILTPKPGMWRLNAYTTSHQADDIGVWLEGVPNYLAPAPEAWFQPEFTTGRAAITLDTGVTSKRPEVGSVWGWHSHVDLARSAYTGLGLASDLIFISQRHVEPENDNGDPAKWVASSHAFDKHLLGRIQASLATPSVKATVLPIINPSDWLVKLEKSGADAALREAGEFFEATVRYLAPMVNNSTRQYYFQFHNEANHFMRRSRFLEYMRELGARKKAMGKEFPANFHLGGPAVGNGVDEKDVVNWDWVESQIREGDSYLDAVVINQYHIQELIDTWQFRHIIDSTRKLIVKHNQDGILEPIVLGQVNMREGVYLQSELQDGFYNALWWLSSLANICQAGSQVALVDYFMLADAGARKKGMYNADGKAKPVALATGRFLRHVESEVVAAKSDHDGLDILATRSKDGKRWTFVYVNKTRGKMEISQNWVPAKVANVKLVTLNENHPGGFESEFPMPQGKVETTLAPQSAAFLIMSL